MSVRFQPNSSVLSETLRQGLGSEIGASSREELGLAADVNDVEVARSIARNLTAMWIGDIGRPSVGGEAEPPELMLGAADSSLLGRIEGFGKDGISVGQLEDPRTWLLLLRGGTLRQRRAVLASLESRWSELSGKDQRAVVEFVEGYRDPELEREIGVLRRQFSGASGRAARAEAELVQTLATALVSDAEVFWDSRTASEPLAAMKGEDRALLLLHSQDLEGRAIRHIAEVIDSEDVAVFMRVALLEQLRYSGDPRFLPTLVDMIDAGSGEVAIEAARCLRGIEDPRVLPPLRRAFDRTVVVPMKCALGASLAMHGDRSAFSLLESLREASDAESRYAYLELAEFLGNKDDIPSVLALTEQSKMQVNALAVLQAIGDRSCLDRIGEMQTRSQSGAVRGGCEEARSAIQARAALLGEPASAVIAPQTRSGTTQGRVSAIRGLWLYLTARLLFAVGATAAATARLERAGAVRPQWAEPWVVLGRRWLRQGHTARALTAFRRVLEVDRQHAERNTSVITAIAEAFSKRADEVEREGGLDIARGLLAEVLDLDLRRLPPVFRLELQRRRRLVAGQDTSSKTAGTP